MTKTRQITSSPRKKTDETKLLVNAVVQGMQEKKAHDIVTLNLKKLGSPVADYFVICHGESRPQLEAIVKSVEELVYKKLRQQPFHIEGYENAEWVLLDFLDVVAHVFIKDKRMFYGIERFWADAEIKRAAAS